MYIHGLLYKQRKQSITACNGLVFGYKLDHINPTMLVMVLLIHTCLLAEHILKESKSLKYQQLKLRTKNNVELLECEL
jgi:hypothetical protein